MFRLLKFVLPACLWIFLARDFLFGSIPFNMDTNTIYGVAKFYFNNLLNGVVPLWDPFVTLGRPFYAASICNLFNPVTQLIPLLKLLGVNYSGGFSVYITAYFLTGCAGFYFLAREVLKDKNMAWLAYVALMFSSFGLSIFTQLTFLEILVPAIWFFYFLLCFGRAQTIGSLLGLTLSFMVVLSAYLPFYFLTVLVIFLLFFIALYPRQAWDFTCAKARFAMKHPWLKLLCMAGMLAAAGPLLSYKLLDASGDAVSPGRHCQYTSVKECYERTMHHKGGMLYEEIARSGGLGERFDLGSLFAHLDKLTYGSDSLLFVPVWIYVLVLLSLFLKLDRLNVLLAGMMAVIGLVALGASAPLHRFLYDHVFFFSYFRNLFFLGAFLVPLAILFALKQLQALLAIVPKDNSHKKLIIVAVLMGHAVFAVFLHRNGGVMPSTYVTLALSAALFVLYYLGIARRRATLWTAVFGVLLMLQPMALIAAYSRNAAEFKCTLPSAHVTPVFSWVRPDTAAISACRIYQFVPYEDFWYAMSMTDAPAKVGYPQAAARWTFALSQEKGEAFIAAYAKYKVYVYDELGGKGRAVNGPAEELDIAHFDVNRTAFRTKFSHRIMLAYNDSFTQAWQVRVDGRKEELLRVNGAFKGVWVPAGEHTVEFSYAPPGGQWVYVLTTIFLFSFLILTALMLLWKK